MYIHSHVLTCIVPSGRCSKSCQCLTSPTRVRTMPHQPTTLFRRAVRPCLKRTRVAILHWHLATNTVHSFRTYLSCSQLIILRSTIAAFILHYKLRHLPLRTQCINPCILAAKHLKTSYKCRYQYPSISINIASFIGSLDTGNALALLVQPYEHPWQPTPLSQHIMGMPFKCTSQHSDAPTNHSPAGNRQAMLPRDINKACYLSRAISVGNRNAGNNGPEHRTAPTNQCRATPRRV